MSQISPPMRILLAGAVVFLAVWFTLLRPKADDTSTPTPASTPAGNVNTGQPAQSEAGKIVEKAKTAATEAEGAAKAAAGETDDATKTTPGTATTTTPNADDPVAGVSAKQLSELPKDVAKAVTGHKVMVFAVLADKGKHWRPAADDDRYVRNTLKQVNRYDGDVFVKQVPLTKIGSYGAIVNDLHVNQTPSVVVVDAKLKANVIAGYLDKVSINQAIADARADSISPLLEGDYLRTANKVCANATVSLDRWSNPTVHGRKANLASAKRQLTEWRNYRTSVRSLATPAKFRGLRKQWLKWLDGEVKVREKAYAAAKKHKSDSAIVSAWNSALVGHDVLLQARKADARFNDAGLTACAINRSR